MGSTMRPPPLPLPKSGDGQPGGTGATRSVSGGIKQVTGTKGEKEKTGRQSFSCAECRRLKLKCSREWPCTSCECEKRGCAQICPNGEMRTGKGKRLILADTAELHQRISLLEVALAQSHAKQSSKPHPLLESPYLFSPRDSAARPYPRPSIKQEGGTTSPLSAGEDDLVQGAFGTLTIGEEGQARFVGSFAGSEYLKEGDESDEDGSSPMVTSNVQLGAPTVNDATRHSQRPPLVTPPATAAGEWNQSQNIYGNDGLGLYSSLFAGGDVKFSLDKLRAELPDYEMEGRALVESYWENVNWQYQPLPKAMFENDHIMNAYDTEAQPNPHKLACVFLVMAIGAMFDLNRPPFHPRGEQLFRLGRSCISIVGLEHASPATVQALHLMGTFILNDKRGNGGEVFWPILGTAVKVAQSLGLHRDGSHFGLSPYEIEERRQVWWEVVSYDRLQALCFGRPCATSNKWSDTKIPEATDLIGDEDGFHRAKYTLITMMERVIDVQTQASAVSYNSVMQLDSELREFKKNLPEHLLPNVAIQDLPLDRSVDPHLVIHRLGIRLQVAQMRLLLNRPLFARALKDNPEDPSRSKLGPSFIALFESAQEIVQLVKTLVIYHPSLVARWWFFWFHAFSSAVCLAAIVIRAPTCAFASPSFHGMSIVCDISAAAREGCRAKKGLPILLRLRKRAHQALEAATRSKARGSGDASAEEDDLSHLNGSVKLRRVQASLHKRSVSSPGNNTGNNSTNGETTPSPQSGTSVATSATLAEPGMFEGLVPTFPGDNSSLPYPIGQPLQTSTTWSDDPINQYINSSVSPPTTMSSFSNGNGVVGIEPIYGQGQGQSPTMIYPVHAGSVGSIGSANGNSGHNGTGPDFVDMDMSMALGMGLPMNSNMGINMNMNMNINTNVHVDNSGQPQVMNNNNNSNSNNNGDVYYNTNANSNGNNLQGHGNIMFGAEGESMFGFNFEEFVNQMGAG
nr:transcriptional regulatory protein [Kwoniella mangroviensis CBS 8507]OCF68372.1 transcriptional regulatory protein [Kwoniella mangroviensis CBS 8507]